MAKIEIEVPDELLAAIGKTPEERAALALQALALECFQTKRWPTGVCGRLMGISRVEFVLLKSERGIPDHLTGQDVVDGYQIIEKLFPK